MSKTYLEVAAARLQESYLRQRRLHAEWSAWARQQTEPSYANDADVIVRQFDDEAQHTAGAIRSLGFDVPSFP